MMETQYDLNNKKVDEDHWKKEWLNLPEFVQEDNVPYHKVLVNFRDEEEVKEFSRMIRQKITKKTHSVHFKKRDRELPSSYVYEEENEK